MSQPPIKFNRLIIIAVIAIVVTGVIVIVLDRNQIAGIIGQANWIFFGIALIAAGGSYCFECISFVILNRLFKINAGLGYLFQIGFISNAIGNVVSTPFGITEHALRTLLLVPLDNKFGDVMAASIFQTYLKDVAILSMAPGILFFMVLTESHPLNVTRIIIVVASLSTALLIIFSLMLFSRTIRRIILSAIGKVWRVVLRQPGQRQITDFDTAINKANYKLRKHPGRGFILLGLMIGDWIFVLGTLELCFMALGLVAPFTILTSGYIVGKTAAILSLIPGGIGVQDISTAGIYALLGISFNIAILAAVLFRVIYQYIPYILSLPLFRILLRLAYRSE